MLTRLRRPHVALTIAFSVLASCLLVAATPPASKTPADASGKPKPPPIVAVKKSDGSTVRGQLVVADGLALTIKPSEAGGKFGEPVDVKWKEIKSVSNGLTQAKALDAWKLEHKDQLCEECHGARVEPCHTCKGTGHDPASSKDCKTCKGEGTVACKHPKCEKGMVPCPGPCLKLSEGNWKKGDEGILWRDVKSKGGNWKFSERHLGEVILYENGVVSGSAPCPVCNKTGKVVCPTCNGKSVVACPTCKANKSADDCKDCDDGTELCAKCNGSGLKTPAAKSAPEKAPEKASEPKAPAPPASKSKSDDGLD